MINHIQMLATLPIGYFWNPATALSALLIALSIAGVTMWVKRGKLKSVHFQRDACNYVRQGSFKLTTKRDDFLYTNTVRIPRSQNNSGGGGRRR